VRASRLPKRRLRRVDADADLVRITSENSGQVVSRASGEVDNYAFLASARPKPLGERAEGRCYRRVTPTIEKRARAATMAAVSAIAARRFPTAKFTYPCRATSKACPLSHRKVWLNRSSGLVHSGHRKATRPASSADGPQSVPVTRCWLQTPALGERLPGHASNGNSGPRNSLRPRHQAHASPVLTRRICLLKSPRSGALRSGAQRITCRGVLAQAEAV
jgi:hypothetical protein